MPILTNRTKMTLICWLFVILLPLVWLWPRFVNPSFSLVDDAHDLHTFAAMKADFGHWWNTSGFHGEVADGRLRPLAWLLRFVFYYLPFGFNPFSWILMHYLNLVLTLSALFFLMRLLVKNNFFSLAGCVLWTFSPCTIENFSRLGPQEVWQVLMIGYSALAIYGLSKARCFKIKAALSFALFVLLFILYFVKEPSIVLLPFSLILFFAALSCKKQVKAWGAFLGLNAFLFGLQRFFSPVLSGYSASFKPSVSLVLENLGRYSFALQWHYLVFFLIITYGVRLYFLLGREKKRPGDLLPECWQFGFLVLAMGFFSIVLLWDNPVQRYLLVTEFLLTPFMVLEASSIFKRLSTIGESAGRKWLPRVMKAVAGLLIAALAFFSRNDVEILLKYTYAKAHEVTGVQALQWFSLRAERNARVLLFTVEEELLTASARFLAEFFGRPDLSIYSFSPVAEKCAAKGLDIIPLKQGDWPAVLNRVDYIFWEHQGAKRYKIDLFHSGLMNSISPEFRLQRMALLYRQVRTYLNPFFPEGTEIWAIKSAA